MLANSCLMPPLRPTSMRNGRLAMLTWSRTTLPEGTCPGTVEASEFLGEFTRYRVRVGTQTAPGTGA